MHEQLRRGFIEFGAPTVLYPQYSANLSGSEGSQADKAARQPGSHRESIEVREREHKDSFRGYPQKGGGAVFS